MFFAVQTAGLCVLLRCLSGRSRLLWSLLLISILLGMASTPLHEYDGFREPDRLAQLMADAAMRRGAPTSAILLEPRSINTREHPIEALKLPGVTSTTPIAVVTSDWHIRRAKQEFRRYFQQVYNYPAPPLQGAPGVQSLIPSAESLGANTLLLREWVGILWYKILGLKRIQEKG